MNKLVTDKFVRFVAQVVLMGASLGVLLGCFAFDYIVIEYYIGNIDATRDHLAFTFVQGISSFYKSDWSTLFTTLAGIFPVVVSSVCYKLAKGGDLRVTEELNETGHAFFVVSVITVLSLLLAMAMLTTLKSSVVSLLEDVAGQTSNYNSVRELANATLSAYAIYIVQFVGMRAK